MSAAPFPVLLARHPARVSAQISIPNPMDVDVVFFCEGVMVEVAFLGALSVHEVELLELAFCQPELECHEGNSRFRGLSRRLLR
jgi:hypothetical protein